MKILEKLSKLNYKLDFNDLALKIGQNVWVVDDRHFIYKINSGKLAAFYIKSAEIRFEIINVGSCDYFYNCWVCGSENEAQLIEAKLLEFDLKQEIRHKAQKIKELKQKQIEYKTEEVIKELAGIK